MTKRLTIALAALAVFALVAVVSAADMDGTGNWSNITSNTSSVFIGEQGLNLASLPGSDNTSVSWYSANSNTGAAPYKTVSLGSSSSVFIDPAQFTTATTGNWFFGSAGYNTGNFAAFQLAEPTIDIQVRDITQDNAVGKVVTGSSVPQGDNLTFVVISNLYAIESQRLLDNNYTNGDRGFVNIKIKTDQGATLDQLIAGTVNGAGVSNYTYYQNVNSSLWYWGDFANYKSTYNYKIYWATGYQDASNTYAYPAGTYTITAEVKLNHMKDNYKDSTGADYSGKTVTSAKTVTLVSDTVQIASNKDTVVRGNPFSVTVTGKPNTYYFVWLKSISSLPGNPFSNTTGYGDVPPTVDSYQSNVYINTTATFTSTSQSTDPAGNYTSQSKIFIQADQPTGAASLNGTYYRAVIKTDDAGKRTVQFSTTRLTKDQKFTIRVERDNSRNAPADQYSYIYSTTPGNNIKSDEVDVTVQKGSVTIVAAGDQNYYLGEEVKLSGTNTESKTTYLFITGPNIGTTYGAKLDDVSTTCTSNQSGTFVNVDVLSDNTWSYKWETQNIALDAGAYTIYAVSDAKAKPDLGDATYGTVSINIKKPFVSATASQSTVAKGDKFYITGTAEGNPSQGVQIWIMGTNYVGPDTNKPVTQTVNSDGTFSYEVKQSATKDLATGQYFVVVQHPMYNNRLDILLNTADGGATQYKGAVYSLVDTQTNVSGGVYYPAIFYMRGATSTSGSLQGSDAAEALIEAINSANVDDTYTKLSVLIEQPVINVDAIPDKYVGDKFTITGTTNLAVGDNILVEVTSSSFKPTEKTQSGEFSGGSGTVQVVKGTSGSNTWSFDVDASTYKPDEYIVKAEAVEQDATGNALFNVLEGGAPTATVTTVATTKIPTTAPTQSMTTVQTTATATTAAPASPGFGALVALIGLGAVAFLVVRKN